MANLTIADLNPTSQTVIGALNDVGGAPQQPTAPPSPVLVIAPGDTTIQVSWSVPSDGGSPILGWQARIFGTAEGSPPAYTQFPAAATGTTFTGLANDTAYTVQVLAYNQIDASPPEVVQATPAPPAAAPGPPTGLVLTPMDQAAGISFTAPASFGTGTFTGYAVSVTDALNVVQTYTMATTSAVLLILENDVALSVTVNTLTSDGVSSAVSGFVTPVATVVGIHPPGIPGPITVVDGNAAATLTWTAPASTGAYPLADYLIRAYPTSISASTRYYSTTSLTAIIGGLVNDTPWFVEVYARSGAGLSAPQLVSTNPSSDGVVPAGDQLVAWPKPPVAPLPGGLYPRGYVAPEPNFPVDTPIVEPTPIPAPNVIAFYPVDDERGTLNGVFSPENWAGVT